MRRGFTLIELMVVVALIGVMASIAVPNFKKYSARSRTTEAKMLLSSLYTAENGSLNNYKYYVTCLNSIGFDVGDNSNLYYAVGFSGEGSKNTSVSSDYGIPCPAGATANTHYFAGGKSVPGGSTCAQGCLPTSSAAGTTFTAGAGGMIYKGSTDKWTIDQTKMLKQLAVGY
ncbi:MAG: prepilin-type N-terminal cleavage/methylation domain-containing protein [Bacteriovoracaceae bacterium]|nr:prepilin-type N-terminal cleavage/methylation domain-containing protein [Bacteriovoracaceae bacterium]